MNNYCLSCSFLIRLLLLRRKAKEPSKNQKLQFLICGLFRYKVLTFYNKPNFNNVELTHLGKSVNSCGIFVLCGEKVFQNWILYKGNSGLSVLYRERSLWYVVVDAPLGRTLYPPYIKLYNLYSLQNICQCLMNS